MIVLIIYKIKEFSFGHFRCDAYENGKVIAYTLCFIKNNNAYGKTFWHLESELNPLIIKGMIDDILIYLKNNSIPFLQTYPIKNKAILKTLATYFTEAIFTRNNIEINRNIINSLIFNINCFNCQTLTQDLEDIERITAIIPSNLGGE